MVGTSNQSVPESWPLKIPTLVITRGYRIKSSIDFGDLTTLLSPFASLGRPRLLHFVSAIVPRLPKLGSWENSRETYGNLNIYWENT